MTKNAINYRYCFLFFLFSHKISIIRESRNNTDKVCEIEGLNMRYSICFDFGWR